MIVACPNCNSRYRADDGVAGSARLKCPKCGLIIDATAPAPGAPAPVALGEIAPAPRTLSAPVGHEWDARVTGPLASVPPAAVDDPLADILPPAPAPASEQEVAALRPAVSQPRDPFYEANPLVVEQPPADAPLRAPRTGYASQPAMAAFARVPGAAPPPVAPDPLASLALRPPAAPAPRPLAAGEPSGELPVVPTRYPTESSDPFANISLVASAEAPPVGGDGGELDVVRSAPAPAPRAPRPAPDVSPPVATAATPFARPAPVERRAEVFPPPPQLAPPVAKPADAATSLLSWIALVVTSAALLLALTFAAWQYELLPLDPALSRAVVRVTGQTSPLVPRDHDTAALADEALAQARAAQQRGALAQAIVHYRRVLTHRPDDTAARAALATCQAELGVRATEARPAP